MKFYYVDSGDMSPYHATLESAKKDANELAKTSRDDIIVKIVEVSTDKDNVLRMLNTTGGHTRFGEVVFTTKTKRKK
jgi:beta-phosphoglucomutase-like phosphatase (HAD superfamily)